MPASSHSPEDAVERSAMPGFVSMLAAVFSPKRFLFASPTLLLGMGCSLLLHFDPAPDGGSCQDGLVYCSGECVNLSSPDHCGTCNQACSLAQFCSGPSCSALSLSSICADGQFIGMYNAAANDPTLDDGVVDQMLQAVQSSCPTTPQVSVRTIQSPDSGVDSAYLPVTPGNQMLLLAGARGSNPVVKALEDAGFTSVSERGLPDGGPGCIYHQDVEIVCQLSGTGTYPFAVEMVRTDPQGSVALIGYGVWGTGTKASGAFVAGQVLPNLSNYPHSWYVVSWTDPDGGHNPGPNDAFQVLASGF